MNKQKKLHVLSHAQIGERQVPIYGSVEEPLFKASDVADVLEHSNARMMVQNVDDDEKVVSNAYTLGGSQETIFLTEAGLYEVFFQSRKPAAKEFKKVVKGILHQLRTTGEVSIRKKSPSKTRVDATMAWIKGLSEVFSLDDVSQQRMYNKFAEDYDLPLLEYTPSNGGRDSLTNLLKKHGLAISAQKANKALADAGYLISREVRKKNGKFSHYYEVADKGKEFGDNFQSDHNPKETQPLWYVNKFTELLPVFGTQSSNI